MKNTEIILQECKETIARKYHCKNWSDVLTESGRNGIPHEFNIRDESYFLYAQRISELFAEWTRVNAEPYIYNKEVWTVADRDGYITHDEITTSELYTLFLEQLNKEI